MKHVKGLIFASLAAASIGLGAGLAAQPSKSRPYHNGSVWEVQYIRVKPGMGDAYSNYLSGQWKSLQEALKKDGLILSYKVIESESHGANDFNVMLMTEYKDLASMEAGESKQEAVAEKVVGDDSKQQQGYKDRTEMREVIGSRLSREIVLEPKK